MVDIQFLIVDLIITVLQLMVLNRHLDHVC
jgi:hypothetical protein